MTFNLDKCKLVRVTNKKHPLKLFYHLQGKQIKSVPHAKYLGVVIDKHLSFNEHIQMITNKANSVKAFLQRNIGSCSETVKETCYKSMVRPILEYSSPVWSPFTMKNITMIESVQRRAVRFVTNNYDRTSSVTAMLLRLDWPSLEQRRKIAKAIMLYKILHNKVAIPFDQYKAPITVFTRGHSQRFHQVAAHVNAYLYSFFPSSIKIWNSLPELIVRARNLGEFKMMIRSYYSDHS